jgi:hypothetical protein
VVSVADDAGGGDFAGGGVSIADGAGVGSYDMLASCMKRAWLPGVQARMERENPCTVERWKQATATNDFSCGRSRD